MNEATTAINNAISFEVKKDGLTQRQSGDWMLRVTVQAIDMHQTIVNAPMGQRFACVLVEIGDDEQAVDHKAMDRDKWRDLGPAKQAGMRCKEPAFWKYLEEITNQYVHGPIKPDDDDFLPVNNEAEAAETVRNLCGVETRADLGRPGHSEARIEWHKLDHAYQAWKVVEHA